MSRTPRVGSHCFLKKYFDVRRRVHTVANDLLALGASHHYSRYVVVIVVDLALAPRCRHRTWWLYTAPSIVIFLHGRRAV